MVDPIASRKMNRCGSFGGGGAAREVELDRCLLAEINFLGAMVDDRGVEICKHKKKRERGRKERAAKSHVEGKMKSHSGIYRA